MTDYFHVEVDNEQLLGMSNLALAHLGDGVYELMVRTWLCMHKTLKVNQLHKATVSYVSASAQAKRILHIMEHLTEQEQTIFRRGRNTAPHSVPKAATRREYQTATGLETLFGWLYLQGKTQRLNEIFTLMIQQDNV